MRIPRASGANSRKKTASASLVLFQWSLTALHPQLVGEALLLSNALDLECNRIDRLLKVLDAPLIQLGSRGFLLASPRSPPGDVPCEEESNMEHRVVWVVLAEHRPQKARNVYQNVDACYNSP